MDHRGVPYTIRVGIERDQPRSAMTIPNDDEGDTLPIMSPDEWAARFVTPN